MQEIFYMRRLLFYKRFEVPIDKGGLETVDCVFNSMYELNLSLSMLSMDVTYFGEYQQLKRLFVRIMIFSYLAASIFSFLLFSVH